MQWSTYVCWTFTAWYKVSSNIANRVKSPDWLLGHIMKKIIILLVQIIYYQCCWGDSGWSLNEKSSKNAQIIAWYVRKTKQLLPHSSWLLFHKLDLSWTSGHSVMLVLILPDHFWQYKDEKKLETKDNCVSSHVHHLGQFIWRWRLSCIQQYF